MEKFDLRSARLISIIIGICIIFFLVVAKAYDYLPTEDVNQKNLSNIEQQEDAIEEQAEEYIEVKEEKDIEVRKAEETPRALEVISDDELKSDSDLVKNNPKIDNEYVQTIERAEKYVDDKKFASAVSEYQKAISLTEKNKEKAYCYEEIAYIYASSKHYGTALANAQKAYNLAPSSSRELLIARLYYKTGDLDRATAKVNNILRRDFSIE